MKKALFVFTIILLTCCQNQNSAISLSSRIVTKDDIGIDILAILVTVLIGWQVWNAIEVFKFVKSANKTKKEYENSVHRLDKRADELYYLQEAFALLVEAKEYKAKSIENKVELVHEYVNNAKAILQFLRAQVQQNYLPLIYLIGRMNTILREVEKLTGLERQAFTNLEHTCNGIYNEIIKTIDSSKNKYADIKDKIMSLRDFRVSINKEYEDISIEEAIRKKDEKQQEKNDTETKPTAEPTPPAKE